jgi:hypothetical protein
MQQWKKNDHGKPDLALMAWLPMEQVITICRVLEHGGQKYAPDNWKGGKFRRYASACLRHLFARLKGEINDPESGLPHLAHAACCILFLMWFDDNGRGH